MNELKIIPTFHLRGIVPSDILERYKQGKFPSLKGEKVNISVTNITVRPKYTENPEDETFLFVDKSGGKNIITTLNQPSFDSWKEKGSYAQGVPCSWCRYPTTDKCVPIPIQSVGTNLFVCDVPYCSFECCLAGLRKEMGITFVTRDPLYRNSEILLKYLFHKEHPEKELKAAPDWRLLDINGGPLTREKFLENPSFLRTTNIVVPAKVCYTQINK